MVVRSLLRPTFFYQTLGVNVTEKIKYRNTRLPNHNWYKYIKILRAAFGRVIIEKKYYPNHDMYIRFTL